MRNNYSALKSCTSYSLINVIISKLIIFPNKQTFHIYLTIIKIKKSYKITHTKLMNMFSYYITTNFIPSNKNYNSCRNPYSIYQTYFYILLNFFIQCTD